jgi:hypothetical protein
MLARKGWTMTLGPVDIFVIQRAIEDYEHKYPRRPAPTAEEALAWRLRRQGKREQHRETESKTEPGLFRWIVRELSGLRRA